jgi:predicted SAM-dependent methyltransferase
VVEHLRDIEAHLADVFRVLRPGGVYRIGGPHGDTAIRKFVDGDRDWFSSWPDDRRSIGGRLENYLMCRGEHVTILTESFLRELLEDAGFGRIEAAVAAHSTAHPELFGDVLRYEYERDPENPETLILEAVKPD